MVVGKLVKDMSGYGDSDKERLGTITQITRIVLSSSSDWQEDVDHWIKYNTKSGNKEGLDMLKCYVTRPGVVATVTWQEDMSKKSIHVFYDDCEGRSSANFEADYVEVIS